MTEASDPIPEDVMQRAVAVAVEIRDDIETWELDGGCDIDFDGDSAAKRIARALMEERRAERERCAAIAEGWLDPARAVPGGQVIPRLIAASIRGQP